MCLIQTAVLFRLCVGHDQHSTRTMLLRPTKLIALALLATIGTAATVRAADPGSVEFFENRIRPVLVQHCYKCHSSQADEIGGSLLLDSSDAMMIGGDSGPTIKPGDAEASVLISAIRYESSEMPPDGKLPARVIHDFEKWIDSGATDPRKGSSIASRDQSHEIDIEAGRKFWAFQPIRFVEPPRFASPRSRGAIDQFLERRLRESRIVMNSIASPRRAVASIGV